MALSTTATVLPRQSPPSASLGGAADATASARLGQEHCVVTYDLAVALKAYSIQELESPKFDNMLILLGNFHVELAIYGALGTMINESGRDYILSESGILAKGSLMGFLRGTFYNRCTRIHEIFATALENLLFEKFTSSMSPDDMRALNDLKASIPTDRSDQSEFMESVEFVTVAAKYYKFFNNVLSGSLGPTAPPS